MNDEDWIEGIDEPLSEHSSREGKRSKAVMLASITVLLMGLGLVAILVTRPQAANVEAASPLINKIAPEIKGNSITDDSPVDLYALRGKFVIINFFASWCGPCQIEEPDLIQFGYEHKNLGDVAIIGVAFDDTTTNARNFLKSTGSTWNAINDSNGQIATTYGVSEPPETFVIDPNGVVLYKFVGIVTLSGLNSIVPEAQNGNG